MLYQDETVIRLWIGEQVSGVKNKLDKLGSQFHVAQCKCCTLLHCECLSVSTDIDIECVVSCWKQPMEDGESVVIKRHVFR